MPNDLGSAKVRIEGDNTGLKASVQESKRELGKLEGGFKRAGNAARNMQKVFSRLFIPVAIATAVASLVSRFMEARQEAERFREELNSIGRASSDRLAKARQEITGLNDIQQRMVEVNREANADIQQVTEATRQAIEKNRGLLGIRGFLTGFDTAEAEREAQNAIAAIARNAREQARLERRITEREQEESIKQTAEQYRDLGRQIEIALMPDADAIEARLGDAIDAARRRLQDLGIFDEQAIQEALESYEQFLKLKAERDRQDLADRIAREERAEREKAERVAKAAGDAMQRELQRALDSVTDSFGFNFTDAADTIAAAIDRNAARRGR